MKKNIKRRWIHALISGKYLQGRNSLKTYDPKSRRSRFCCLGVLCDLYAKEKNVAWSVETNSHPFWASTWYRLYFFLGEPGTLTKEVSVWAGIADEEASIHTLQNTMKYRHNKCVLTLHVPDSLIDANDDYKYNFAQIAELIRRFF
jgi:hypothetical protein